MDITRDSDLDLAILLDKALEESFSLPDFAVLVERICRCAADAAILSHAGEVLKLEVSAKCLLIFDRSPSVRKQCEIMGRKSYEDFLHLCSRYVKRVLYQD